MPDNRGHMSRLQMEETESSKVITVKLADLRKSINHLECLIGRLKTGQADTCQGGEK